MGVVLKLVSVTPAKSRLCPLEIQQAELSVAVTFAAEAVVRVMEVIVQLVVPAIVMAEFTGMLAIVPPVKVGVKVTGALVVAVAVPIVP